SPRTRRSAARPPRRTARVSARYPSPYSRRSSEGSVSVSPRACPAPRTVTRLTGSAYWDNVATRAWPASWTATVASSPGASGLLDDDLAVETAGPAQRGIQGIRPVGGGQHDHPAGLVESVHLGEQLVQGLLPFVAACEAAVVAAGAEGVDLVNEHDRRPAGAG